MSFILDALKRAEHERSRGAVPDIHAAPLALPAQGASAMRRLPVWPTLALGLALGAAAVAGWWYASQAPVAPTTAATVATTVRAAAPASQATAAATAALPVVGAAHKPMPAPMPPAPTPPAPTSPAPILSSPLPAALPPQPAPPFLLPAAKPALGSAAPIAAGAALPPASADAVLAMSAAPEDVRRQLAGLRLSGAIHSARAADRLLIVDGQVAREGDSVAPGVVLEKILPRSAIFRLRQYRVELPV